MVGSQSNQRKLTRTLGDRTMSRGWLRGPQPRWYSCCKKCCNNHDYANTISLNCLWHNPSINLLTNTERNPKNKKQQFFKWFFDSGCFSWCSGSLFWSKIHQFWSGTAHDNIFHSDLLNCLTLNTISVLSSLTQNQSPSCCWTDLVLGLSPGGQWSHSLIKDLYPSYLFCLCCLN